MERLQSIPDGETPVGMGMNGCTRVDYSGSAWGNQSPRGYRESLNDFELVWATSLDMVAVGSTATQVKHVKVVKS